MSASRGYGFTVSACRLPQSLAGNRKARRPRVPPHRRAATAREFRGRCVATHDRSGARCARVVGRGPVARLMCVCASHAKFTVLVLLADDSSTLRQRTIWSFAQWENVAELPIGSIK
jgi:hypothetical protein